MNHPLRQLLLVTAVLAATAACNPPFGLGTPSTRALENGAAAGLTGAKSFEITGSYLDSLTWTVDLQLARPGTEHAMVSSPKVKLEAIVIGNSAYFRGQQFLSQTLGSDPNSQNLVKAAGNAWWKGSPRQLPQLPDFTDGAAFRSTFLGPVASQRTDHVSVDGVDAIELSGVRADVYIAAAPPYDLLRVHLKPDVAIDGITNADFRYGNFDRDFNIAAPSDVIDFSNLSTLPPIYSVLSVDTSRCGSPCSLSAVLKNLGGMSGAKAPSTVTFTVTDSATGQVVGTCKAQVVPDVGYNATTTVSCSIGTLNGQQLSAASVTATPENPGRG